MQDHKREDDPLAKLRVLEAGDPELGTVVDVEGRGAYSIYEAALLYAGRPVVQGGFFGSDLEGARARLNLDARSRDICDELLNAIDVHELRASPSYDCGPPHILESTVTRDELIRWFGEIGERPAFLFARRDASEVAEGASAGATPGSPAQPHEQRGGSGLPARPGKTAHSTKTERRDKLAPVFDEAQARCRTRGVDPLDWNAVWNQLLDLAREQLSPLMGVAVEGIKYLEPTKSDGVDYLTRPAVRMRISRQRDRGGSER